MIVIPVENKIQLKAVVTDKFGNVVKDVAGAVSWSVNSISATVEEGLFVAGTVASTCVVTAQLGLPSGLTISGTEDFEVVAGPPAKLVVVADGGLVPTEVPAPVIE